MNYKDKVVVITGGTSGIGKQAAIEFSRKGAHVVAFTVDKEEVCKEAIKEIGNDASYIHCDVSKEEDVKKAIEEVVLKYGRLDCAFNNAGIGPDGVRMPYESLTEVSEKTWDLVVDVDMKGVFLCLKYELLQMQKQGFGARFPFDRGRAPVGESAGVDARKPLQIGRYVQREPVHGNITRRTDSYCAYLARSARRRAFSAAVRGPVIAFLRDSRSHPDARSACDAFRPDAVFGHGADDGLFQRVDVCPQPDA